MTTRKLFIYAALIVAFTLVLNYCAVANVKAAPATQATGTTSFYCNIVLTNMATAGYAQFTCEGGDSYLARPSGNYIPAIGPATVERVGDRDEYYWIVRDHFGYTFDFLGRA